MSAKKYLEKLSSIYDLNLFKLNGLEDTNPGDSLYNYRIHSRYYSPYSFYKFKSELPSRVSDSSFSLLNLENFKIHLLDELNFEFSIIGVSETKIISGKEMDFNPSIPGYVFEYVPIPLASGGVGLYINDSLKYTVIEKVFDEAFQSLWIEIQLPQKSNIICGIIYRQYNSPKRFQEYFDDKLERLITSKKSIYIMVDFNINLLHAETSCYAQDFLLSLQSFSFIPTIDKPTRVYNNSAALINNILTNKVDVEIASGNIISDISDHYSQFCISHNFIQRPKLGKQKRRDFSNYSRSKFNSELSDALVSQTNFSDHFDVNTAFSYFYNTLLALVDKHAPLKTACFEWQA